MKVEVNMLRAEELVWESAHPDSVYAVETQYIIYYAPSSWVYGQEWCIWDGDYNRESESSARWEAEMLEGKELGNGEIVEAVRVVRVMR